MFMLKPVAVFSEPILFRLLRVDTLLDAMQQVRGRPASTGPNMGNTHLEKTRLKR